jgi:transcription elongation factor Elf1
MKIKEVTSRSNFDFTAVLVCEHCGHEGVLTTGYDDSFYHNRVIPVIQCKSCGLNRAGNKDVPPDVSLVTV